MQGWREWVALIERLLDAVTGLGQARVIYGYAHQPPGAVSQGAVQDGAKQFLRLPLTTRMQKILRAPTAMLAAVGPNDAGQAAPAQADQRTQGLPHGTVEGARLRKHSAASPQMMG